VKLRKAKPEEPAPTFKVSEMVFTDIPEAASNKKALAKIV
jgi:hypothetical protein